MGISYGIAGFTRGLAAGGDLRHRWDDRKRRQKYEDEDRVESKMDREEARRDRQAERDLKAEDAEWTRYERGIQKESDARTRRDAAEADRLKAENKALFDRLYTETERTVAGEKRVEEVQSGPTPAGPNGPRREPRGVIRTPAEPPAAAEAPKAAAPAAPEPAATPPKPPAVGEPVAEADDDKSAVARLVAMMNPFGPAAAAELPADSEAARMATAQDLSAPAPDVRPAGPNGPRTEPTAPAEPPMETEADRMRRAQGLSTPPAGPAGAPQPAVATGQAPMQPPQPESPIGAPPPPAPTMPAGAAPRRAPSAGYGITGLEPPQAGALSAPPAAAPLVTGEDVGRVAGEIVADGKSTLEAAGRGAGQLFQRTGGGILGALGLGGPVQPAEPGAPATADAMQPPPADPGAAPAGPAAAPPPVPGGEAAATGSPSLDAAVEVRLGDSGSEPTKNDLDRFMEVWERDAAPEVVKHYLRNGQIEEAKAFTTWLEQEGVRRGVRAWARGVSAAAIGDADAAIGWWAEAYNTGQYADDGYRVLEEESGMLAGPNGEPLGGFLTFEDEETGETTRVTFESMEELYQMGTYMLSPEAIFQQGIESLNAAAASELEHQQQLELEAAKAGARAVKSPREMIDAEISELRENDTTFTFSRLTPEEQVQQAIASIEAKERAASGLSGMGISPTMQ
jgi:hypothetical protein